GLFRFAASLRRARAQSRSPEARGETGVKKSSEIPVSAARGGVTLTPTPARGRLTPRPAGAPGGSTGPPESPSVAHPSAPARAPDQEPADLDRLFASCRNYLGIVARAQVESWLRAKMDASDLIQQTLLEAYRDFSHFRGTTEAEWLAWLRRILAHNAANFVR